MQDVTDMERCFHIDPLRGRALNHKLDIDYRDYEMRWTPDTSAICPHEINVTITHTHTPTHVHNRLYLSLLCKMSSFTQQNYYKQVVMHLYNCANTLL